MSGVAPPRRALAGALVALGVLGAAACSGSGEQSDAPPAADRGEVLAALVDDVVVPGYEDLAGTAAALAGVTEDLCATPTEANLGSARAAWDGAQGAWARTAAYRVGPVESLRLAPRIAYAVDADKVRALAEDPDGPGLVTVELLTGKGADLRGLRAVEQLLFAPADVAALTPRGCSYAAAASRLVADATAELLTAWTDGVDGEASARDQLARPGDGGMWESESEGYEDLLDSTLAALTTVVDMQLGPASGATTETPEPQEVDAAPAHRALADVADELTSVAAVYGDPGAAPPAGLAALVVSAAPSTSDEAIRSDLAAAMEDVAAVPAPMYDLDASDAGSPSMRSLASAYEHSLAVRSALATEIASLLGLTVSFSDADGDG